ncbi:DNA-directed RNA polymerase [Shimia sp.]|uniref:DNA-directed RNA polymerase n=1 Tax=Shimia sp. TaxID=1954381 RepID=UPI003BAD58EA
MNDDLYISQIELEDEMRNESIRRFEQGLLKGDLSETKVGNYLIYGYINPLKEKLDEFLSNSGLGKAGRQNSAAKCLAQLPTEVSSYLFIKGFLNRIPLYNRENTRLSVTSLAVYVAGLLHDELRIREFEAENASWLKTIKEDFNKRELPRNKRLEYLQRVIKDADQDWSRWSLTDRLHIGVKLLDLFIQISGDAKIEKVRQGRHAIDVVVPSEGLLKTCERIKEDCSDTTSTWYPMIHKPLPWTKDSLNRGSYVSQHVTPYPLVKGGNSAYRKLLKDCATKGDLDTVLLAVNSIQDTPWRINPVVVDALSYVYDNNIECGKLPRADNKVPDEAPYGLEYLPADHPKVVDYRRYRATIHEHNRRSVGKRVLAIRALTQAERFSKYGRIYFPHDLDSRGRAYPKPYPLNPQGPDFIKGMLEFADGKRLGEDGLYWLGVHGANCFGEDKLYLDERAAWSQEHITQIKEVASDPKGNLWWTRADNPVQFLAFCLEYSKAYYAPENFVSHLHVDLDATCSGLQHFSAMLRDSVGGFHVNLVPNFPRQDVYGAVAKVANDIFNQHSVGSGDNSGLAQAWLKSGFMDRKVSKRPVMVKPYAGTLTSCLTYVRGSVEDKLEDGHPLPWPKDDMFNFKVYGGKVVWEAIPKVVVAADQAMKWLSEVSRAVAKSQPEEHRIEWTTPVGFPVWQYKFKTNSRQVRTHLDGKVYKPSLVEETDKLDSRQMASSTPPSFVHSLDGAHLQLTTAKATTHGITHFAMVHDSFGVHAADVSTFSRIIREAFVEMYQQDVLQDFYDSASQFISEEFFENIPPIPERGDLDLDGVLDSEFFFS